jgi:TolB protein
MNQPIKPTRPIEVSLIAVLYFGSGLISLVSFVSAILRGDSLLQQTPFTMDMLVALALVVGSIILQALIGWELWRLRPLARTIVLVLQGGLIILSLISWVSRRAVVNDTALLYVVWGAINVVGLNTPRARRSFGVPGGMPLGIKLLLLATVFVVGAFWIEHSKLLLPQIDNPHDAKAISFISNRYAQVEARITGGPMDNKVLTMNADGSGVSYLKGTSFIYGPSVAWAPDGRAFAMRSWEPDPTRVCITIIEAAGRKCLVRDGHAPSWSPDGKYIAYSTDDSYSLVPENVRAAAINLVEVSSQVVTPLITFPPPQDAINRLRTSTVTWAPDGKTIAYSTQTYTFTDSTLNEDVGSIWLMSLDNKQPVFLTSGQSPAWSPTRKEIAFQRNQDILLYDLETRTEQVLVHDPKAAHSPAWSPDGQQLLFTSLRDGNAEIYRINRDGTGLVNLTNNEADDFAPAWHPKS